jgi:LysM repeat protein
MIITNVTASTGVVAFDFLSLSVVKAVFMSTTRIFAPASLAACALATAVLCAAVPVGAQVSPASATEPSLPYTVKPKDKLIVLSKSLLVDTGSWPEVARFNQLKNPNMISPGQEVKIPLRLLKPLLANGKVISVEGDVKMGAQTMQAGAALPEGARLQTGANSSAVVELGDGSRVQILPNSIAQIITQRRYSTDAAAQATGSASTTWFSGAIRLVQGTIDTSHWKCPPPPPSLACAARNFVWPTKTL